MLWRMQLWLSSALHEGLLSAAHSAHPHECCGLLFGQNGSVDRFLPTANVAADPARTFEIDPAALIGAERETRLGGDRLIGYYHSHPNGRAEPSRCDAESAAPDGRLWLLIAGGTVTGWRARRGGALLGMFDPVAVSLVR